MWHERGGRLGNKGLVDRARILGRAWRGDGGGKFVGCCWKTYGGGVRGGRGMGFEVEEFEKPLVGGGGWLIIGLTMGELIVVVICGLGVSRPYERDKWGTCTIFNAKRL